jgi:hypothetical protein
MSNAACDTTVLLCHRPAARGQVATHVIVVAQPRLGALPRRVLPRSLVLAPGLLDVVYGYEQKTDSHKILLTSQCFFTARTAVASTVLPAAGGRSTGRRIS